jgi:hypothetical protein
VKRKFPPPILAIYAVLLSTAALNPFRRALAPGASTPEIVFNMSEAAFMMILGIGILRLWRVAWIAAIVYCWLFFIVLAVVLFCWCVFSHSMSLLGTALLAAATAFHVYVYIVLRRDEIRALFRRTPGDAKA